jgi:hypothetical protein
MTGGFHGFAALAPQAAISRQAAAEVRKRPACGFSAPSGDPLLAVRPPI